MVNYCDNDKQRRFAQTERARPRLTESRVSFRLPILQTLTAFSIAAIFMGTAPIIGYAKEEATPVLPADVAPSADKTHPLTLGASLPPHLELTTIDDKPFDLDAAVHAKPTVLIFYRGGWCPFCNLQMGKLQEIEPKLRGLGYQILAISADNPEHLRESLAKHKLTYTLLSDKAMAASRAFGLAFRVNDETTTKYKGHGVDLEAASGRTDHYLPIPAAYVFDRNGRIQFAYSNPDFRVRVNPDDLLSAAQAALAPPKPKG